MSRLRDAGYRVAGKRLDYLLHLRPAEWPIMAVHFLTGAALAVGIGAQALDLWRPLLLATMVWVVALNGGTLIYRLPQAIENEHWLFERRFHFRAFG
jgi:hypothetical protein